MTISKFFFFSQQLQVEGCKCFVNLKRQSVIDKFKGGKRLGPDSSLLNSSSPPLQDPGGTGDKGVHPGSVPAPSRRKALRGGFLFGVDTPRALPHRRDALRHRQLSVFLQPRGRQLHSAHTPLRGTGPAPQTWKSACHQVNIQLQSINFNTVSTVKVGEPVLHILAATANKITYWKSWIIEGI